MASDEVVAEAIELSEAQYQLAKLAEIDARALMSAYRCLDSASVPATNCWLTSIDRARVLQRRKSGRI